MQKHGLFATPETWEDLEAWILRHPKDQHISLYTAAFMAHNFVIEFYTTSDKGESND